MRSSSKLITRAKSVRNMGKVPFKFRFDFLIESVDKIAASGDVVVIWERNKKSDCTAPAKIDRTTRKANFGNQKISARITLFKVAPTDKKFQDKVVKIAVRAKNEEGKTLGKIHLNLADYTEVPFGSKRISAELSSGASLIATIQCTFVAMGKVTRSKGDDLGLEGEEESDGGDDETDTELELLGSSRPHKLKITRTGSKKVGKHFNKDDDLGNGAYGDGERHRKENQRLRKRLEEMERNQHVASQHGSGDLQSLQQENESLKREVVDLKSTLSREPLYHDVVKELTEAKLALALLQLDRDSMQLELQKHQKGNSSPNTIVSSVRQ